MHIMVKQRFVLGSNPVQSNFNDKYSNKYQVALFNESAAVAVAAASDFLQEKQSFGFMTFKDKFDNLPVTCPT